MTAGSWTSNEVGLDPQYVLIGESTCHSACLTQHWCVCGGGGGGVCMKPSPGISGGGGDT
jgi:hypothetical protein